MILEKKIMYKILVWTGSVEKDRVIDYFAFNYLNTSMFFIGRGVWGGGHNEHIHWTQISA